MERVDPDKFDKQHFVLLHPGAKVRRLNGAPAGSDVVMDVTNEQPTYTDSFMALQDRYIVHPIQQSEDLPFEETDKRWKKS